MSYPDPSTTHNHHHNNCQHNHHHPTIATHSADLAQNNAAHFDTIAHEHAHSHHVKQVASTIAHKIVELLGFPSQPGQNDDDDDNNNNNDNDNHGDNIDPPNKEKEITVLDYACGTGSMTWALFDNLNGKWKHFVGVDISPKSVELYNQRAATQFAPKEMHALCSELTGQPGELGGQKFDIIVCSQAYHHFANVKATTAILASFLNPGGKLFIADQMAHDGTLFKSEHDPAFAAAAHTVSHRGGFAEEEMKSLFEQDGGLQDFRWLPNIAAVGNKSGSKRVEIFLAVGTKPESASVVV